ncbi:unnamed protein product, partial [Oppiella nova]
MAKDIRYNYYNIIEYNPNKWSKNWTEFSGFSYIPGVTEWENWLFDKLNADSLHDTKGFTASFCQSDYYKDSRLNWWYLLFVWSKVIELIDTLFILLRNGKLLTLHWVHHVLTLCYSWYVFGDVPATARWM